MTSGRFILLTILSVFLGCATLSAQAQDQTPDKKEAAAEAAKGAERAVSKKPADPDLVALEARSLELSKTLKEEELKHLFYIRETFGSTRAVKVVRRDVEKAVKACAKENPDMRTTLTERFSNWAGAIDPVLESKNKEIDAAIAEQTYLKPKDIKDYLKMIEKAADNVDKGITKTPITTPQACNGLLTSMDHTQKTLAELIASMTLSPWPPVVDDTPVQKRTSPNN